MAYQLKYGTATKLFNSELDAKYHQALAGVFRIENFLQRTRCQFYKNAEIIEQVKANYISAGILHSPLLEEMAQSVEPIDYDLLFNEIVMKQFVPLKNELIEEIQKTLDPDDLYDQMIAGLLGVDGREFTLEEAIYFITE